MLILVKKNFKHSVIYANCAYLCFRKDRKLNCQTFFSPFYVFHEVFPILCRVHQKVEWILYSIDSPIRYDVYFYRVSVFSLVLIAESVRLDFFFFFTSYKIQDKNLNFHYKVHVYDIERNRSPKQSFVIVCEMILGNRLSILCFSL